MDRAAIAPGYKWRGRCYRHGVRMIVALVACLMVFTSIGVGSAVRAADVACCTDTVAGVAAVDQDGCGATPVACDKNCPHHGTCHGHQVAATADADAAVRPSRMSSIPAVAVVARLIPVDLDGSRRPPRA